MQINNTSDFPSRTEVALGTFLHDIGKLFQRAYGSSSHLPSSVRDLESILLPNWRGNYSHKHALWSEHFFQLLERRGLYFPEGIRREHVRRVAVFHHNPDGPEAMLCTAADRLSAGMERKEKDIQRESDADHQGWDAFIRTPLRSPFEAIDLGLGKPPERVVPLTECVPGPGLLPCPSKSLNLAGYQQTYRNLSERMMAELPDVLNIPNIDVFSEALLSLSERFLSTVPSSTNDEPDVSLHDHCRVAAGIAAALYAWHEEHGSLRDKDAIADNRSQAKFRILAGDLSGIQTALFRLSSQNVKGVNRILRARSFSFSMLIEAALLAARRIFDLPIFSVLQNAGGRFQLLVPALHDAEERVAALRTEVDQWMLRRYRGELSLNLALSDSFPGQALLRQNLPALSHQLALAIEDSKFRAFRSVLQPIIATDTFENGPCAACGYRPGSVLINDSPGRFRCEVCEEEHRLGGGLPHTNYIGWASRRTTSDTLPFFSGLWLEWHKHRPAPSPDHLSLARVFRGSSSPQGPLALRYLANYVPRFSVEDLSNGRYNALPDAQHVGSGDAKTFECLALDARQKTPTGWKGEDHLAVLKADVDRLGAIFARRHDSTIARHAAISRLMDLFFTGFLYRLLEEEFPSTYTVYAGGDDLLLIGPWNQTLQLASRLRESFDSWVGNNPNITLSAGVELMKSNHPLNRTVLSAENRLEQAKDSGRNCISAIDTRPVSWNEYGAQLQKAGKLADWLDRQWLSTQFLYKILYFDRLRRSAEPNRDAPANRKLVLDLQAAGWRAQWAYHLSRAFASDDHASEETRRRKAEIVPLLNALLGLDEHLKRHASRDSAPRIAVSIALYQNRNPSGESL